MKKVLALLLVFLTVASLTACSPTSEPKSETNASSAPVDNSAAESAGNKVVIYSGAEEYRNEYFLKRLNEEFPDYDITIEYMPTGNLAAKLAAEGT